MNHKILSTPSKYKLSELSKKDYIYFLKEANKRHFIFYRVKDAKNIKSSSSNIILRHDIDFSLKYAFEMAQIESSLNIYATYYVMIDGQFYNILNNKNIKYLKQIKNMGHEIGLHFDSSKYENIEHQIKILEAIIEDKVYSIAQHNPVQVGFFKDSNLTQINAYNIPKTIINIEYISDSGMMWRKYNFKEGLELTKNLYILAHPISWLNSKNDLISIMREIEFLEIKSIKKSFNDFINGHISYYKKRTQNS